MTERAESERAELVALNEWMREPDYAEDFSLSDITDWINRRPIATAARLAALDQMPGALDPLEMLLDAARYAEGNGGKCGNLEWAKAARAAVAKARLVAPDQKPVAWQCAGCGRLCSDPNVDFEDIKSRGFLSCCPERKMEPAYLSPPPAAGWDDDAIKRAKDALFNIAKIHGYRLNDVELSESVRAVTRALRHNAPPDSGAGQSAPKFDSAWDVLANAPRCLPDHGGADTGVGEAEEVARFPDSEREFIAAALSHHPAPVAANLTIAQGCADFSEAPPVPWPDPTPAMLDGDALFDAIWQTIKSWDVNVPAVYGGYCGANGNHARAIYDAVKSAPVAANASACACLQPGGDPLGTCEICANASAEARLREALFVFREFVNVNVTQWTVGAGDHHHPIWSLISRALGPDRERNRTEAEWRFIQPEQRDILSAHPHASDCDKQGER